MGNCCDCPEPYPDPDPDINPDVIPSDLEKIKFCLLGTGDSGKSTLFKQMRINYVRDYSPASLQEENRRIIRSFISSFGILAKAILTVNQTLGSKELDEFFVNTIQDQENRVLTDEIVDFISSVWKSQYAQDLWPNRGNFQIPDSLEYFSNNLERLSDPDYEPTEKDYLLCRIATSGVTQQTFVYKEVTMTVVDVGGQRNERKKWMIAFDGAQGIFYVASISEFDQRLYEDNSILRFEESINQFRKTATSFWFREAAIILFLNKEDIFNEKINRIVDEEKDLDEYFPTLKLGKSYDNCKALIKEHMVTRFIPEEVKGKVYPHFITATDTDAFKFVFQLATTIVLEAAIEKHFNQQN